MHPHVQAALDAVMSGHGLNRTDAVTLIPLFETELPDLMAVARLAASRGGAEPTVCTVVNARSGGCGEDCTFCAQSRQNRTGVTPSPLLEVEEMIAAVERAVDGGATHVGLVCAGHRQGDAALERCCAAARAIRSRMDVALCASLGAVTKEEADRLAEAGFSRYHHNLETSRSFFSSVCTTHSYDDRLATIANVKAAGLKVCSGGIFGIGEGWADRIELFEDLVLAGAASIPINFLIPIPGTPCESQTPLTAREGLAILIMIRLLAPDRTIIMAAGRRECLGDMAPLVLAAGVNGLMIGDFLTRPGSAPDVDRQLLRLAGWGREPGR